jgi:predicted O-methyltransferase YrrM
MATDTLNLTPQVLQYYRSVAYREPALLAELRAETAKMDGNAGMQIAAEQGAFMGMLAGLIEARQILEIGTFTGYSSLAMALAAPEAHLTCADVSENFTAMARRYWKKAGIEARVRLKLTGGKAVIDDLLTAGQAGTFDMMFIDADKTSYDIYYEGGLKLLRQGGLMMIDNVLWGGAVADPAKNDADTESLRRLNAKIFADPRVALIMVPIGDGLTLARKL